jgi:hypothetical protein
MSLYEPLFTSITDIIPLPVLGDPLLLKSDVLLRATTTRKILIGADLLVADYFGAALLLRAAAWKNMLRYHY